MSLNKAILTAMVQHSIYLNRTSSGAINDVFKIFDSASSDYVEKILSIFASLSDAEKIAFQGGNYTTPKLKKMRGYFEEWQKEINVPIFDEFSKGAELLAGHESAFVSRIADADETISGAEIFATIAKKPIVNGYLISEMFKKMADDTVDVARRELVNGIASGFTNYEIRKRILGTIEEKPLDGALRARKIELDRFIRTARMSISNDAYLETYKAIGFTHVKVVATLDGRTCKYCASIDGNVYAVDDATKPKLPQHYNSRTVYVGCDESGETIGRRPYVEDKRKVKDIPKDQRKIGQVNSSTDYESWFENTTEDFKKEWLGKTRYNLYKGGMSIGKFVDDTGKTYTIAELRVLDKKLFKELGL